MAKAKDTDSKESAPQVGTRAATGETVQATPGGYEDSDRGSIPARQAGENVTTGVSLSEEAVKSESTPGTPRVIKPLPAEEESGTTRALVASAPQSEAIPYPTSTVAAVARRPPFVARVSGSRKLVVKTLEAQAKSVRKLKNPDDKNDKTGEIAAEGLEGVIKMVENFEAGKRDRLEVSYSMDLARGVSNTNISVKPAEDLHAKFASLEEMEEYHEAQLKTLQEQEGGEDGPKAGSGAKKWAEEQKQNEERDAKARGE
jgi:hypothetical protein